MICLFSASEFNASSSFLLRFEGPLAFIFHFSRSLFTSFKNAAAFGLVLGGGQKSDFFFSLDLDGLALVYESCSSIDCRIRDNSTESIRSAVSFSSRRAIS